VMAPVCLAAAIIGIGLWRLLPWARAAFMVFCGLDVCFAIAATIELFLKRSCTSATWSSAFFSVLFLFYFSRRKIKDRFRTFQATSESTT
jgi:hypothetical protein